MLAFEIFKIEAGIGEDLTEEFLQRRLYTNKSLTKVMFPRPNPPPGRRASTSHQSRGISVNTSDRSGRGRGSKCPSVGPDATLGSVPFFYRHNSSLNQDANSISTASTSPTGVFISVVYFVALLVGIFVVIFTFVLNM